MHSPEVVAFSINSPFKRKVKEKSGRTFSYREALITVWHIEPGGADALTVCRDRVYDKHTGKFKKYSKLWKLHFWHYKISWSLLYKWRRWLFTRCAECGGPSRQGNRVDHSDSGGVGRPKTPLWCGEVHLYHSACLSQKSKLMHEHDPRGCYQCSGTAAFEYTRRMKNTSHQIAKRLFKRKT